MSSADKYARPPALKPETLALVPAWIREREAALEIRMSPAEIAALLRELCAVLPVRKGVDEVKFTVGVADFLRDAPAPCVREALREIARTHKWWPAISEIVKGVEERKRVRGARIERLRWLQAAQDFPPPHSVPDDYWRAEMAVRVARARRSENS